MAEPRSLVVQSVLYGNQPHEIVRAAEAMSNSVGMARSDGLIGRWSLILGDCSPEATLSESDQAEIRTLVDKQGGNFQYELFGENLGSAAGHNALAAMGDSELVLILNPDAIVAPDSVMSLCRSVEGSVGIAEARQIPLEHPKDFEPGTGETSWASTACALTPRVAFDEVGGFDAQTFFLYCDDVDYSWRLRLAGYRVVYDSGARVFHDKRLTVSGDWPASPAEIYYSAEAAMFLAHKYSHPEIVDSLRRQYRLEGTESVLKAVAAFESALASGILPDPIDPAHNVGQFIGGNYAVHRF
ncbi:glycosyltransferase family 2 protein [Cryobacterium serini]|uniref:Glycosyltransferase family 2 protein n=1 Tax=Cryobacterium serini TaxID=1259201 RepID=A0A4R9BKF0_9MICO|nr:glycosyltransferase family 2 protein [Cryobacterium serini]TFD86265.1 glycosyltransferase family 2 protein [Cryobacterium serini]